MLHFPFKTAYPSALVLIGLGFFVCSSTAVAKTVSVTDIIRQDTENAPTAIDTQTLPQDLYVETIARAYTAAPLFLTPARIHTTAGTPTHTRFNVALVYEWVSQLLGSQATAAVDAHMTTQNGRVTDFTPSQDGFYPDAHATTIALLNNLQNSLLYSPVIGITVHPRVSLEQTNTLGINTLLSGGLSDFSGSSKNRKANIEAGSKKVRGLLVSPGETFSFNQYLGDVTAEDGFKPEIVIKADGLKPELGGGICQVSSTLFRAVMQSGMPITTRKNHAFSVNHYFPPGTDATVYSPYTDFKFINDTPATVLIWNYYKNDRTLAFDLYGTKDTRSVEVDEPIQWDRKSDGSLKASWTRRVVKDGARREDVFKSNYLPPALFKKEEKFVVTNDALNPPLTNPPLPSAVSPQNTQ